MILRYITEFTVIIPAVIFAVLPLRDNLRFRSLYTYMAGAVLIPIFIFAGAFIRVEYMFSTSSVMIVFAFIFFVIYFMIIDSRPGRKLFCFFNSMMLCMFCPMYTVMMMADTEAENEIWNTAGVFMLKSGIANIFITIVIAAMFFRTLYVKLSMLIKQEHFTSIWDFIFLLPLFMTMLMWWMMPHHPNLMLVGRLRSVSLVVVWLMPLGMLLLYHLLWWIAMKLTEGAKLQYENTLLIMEAKRYEELRKYMDETRVMRHDFRQHILVISKLSRSENFDELQNYLIQFSDGTDKSYTGYCENIAVDAVASHYTSFADSQKTRIEWKLNLPHELPMKESEYCAVLGNLIENSLRAVKNLPENKRYVRVISSLLSEHIIGISIDNPFAGKIKHGKNGLPRSELEGHGIGLMSVMNTVKRYRGTMKITEENQIFSVNIIIQCNI